ncbi:MULTISPECIES: secondary thiamine-phosphate synthase enzyme YjbQ [unclassified Nitrospina]|uniref:secondary thiamine-phosphate synthase enzyme YjbQ n=1 Tax=unclassified Nitrospina TaxID=2638683 RepID=UPI003F9843A0
MQQRTHEFTVATRGRGLHNINATLVDWVEQQGLTTGLLNVFLRHTSASLVIQENADPDVLHDLDAYLTRLVPDGDPRYRHDAEGPDDMPAHIRAALTQTQIAIPLVKGRLTLGTWQDVYLFEHRTEPHRRKVVLHLMGE